VTNLGSSCTHARAREMVLPSPLLEWSLDFSPSIKLAVQQPGNSVAAYTGCLATEDQVNADALTCEKTTTETLGSAS
jgi:hypothetical protein